MSKSEIFEDICRTYVQNLFELQTKKSYSVCLSRAEIMLHEDQMCFKECICFGSEFV